MREFWDEPKFKRCSCGDVNSIEVSGATIVCFKDEVVLGDTNFLYRIVAKNNKLFYYKAERT